MKNINHNQKLFITIVDYLETVIAKPSLKQFDVGNYSQLADALNLQGIRNSKGSKLTKETIKKCIQRTKNKEQFYPEVFCKKPWEKTSLWDFIKDTDTQTQKSKSEEDLDKFTWGIISNNHSHFYEEKNYA